MEMRSQGNGLKSFSVFPCRRAVAQAAIEPQLGLEASNCPGLVSVSAEGRLYPARKRALLLKVQVSATPSQKNDVNMTKCQQLQVNSW